MYQAESWGLGYSKETKQSKALFLHGIYILIGDGDNKQKTKCLGAIMS